MVQLSLASVAAPAGADVEAIRLAFSAYRGCPDEDRFLHEITARTERVRRAAEGEPARVFVVVVTRETSTIRGVLSIMSLDGAVSRREVRGESCDEVVSALALMMALAVDPLAATAPASPPAVTGPSISRGAGDVAPAGPPWDAPPPASTPVNLVAPHAQHPPSPPGPRSPDQLPAAASTPATPGPARGVRWAIGAEGQAFAGLVPGWVIGGGGFVDATGPARGHLVPSFRASLFASSTRVALAGPVGAQVDWFVARMAICPFRLAEVSNLVLSICAALDAGVLRSIGMGLQHVGIEVRPWLAPAALGRVGWSPPGAFFVEGGGGLMAPLTRYSFYFQQSGVSEAPLHRIPLVAPNLQVDAGYRFP
jgi:hypothetical protein